MQMNLRCGGNFTTNASVVDQISKGQDVSSFFSNPTTLLLLLGKSYFETALHLFNVVFRLLLL